MNHDILLFFSLGGTLGLFTGMSFISVIEMVYWIFKTLVILPITNKLRRAANHGNKI